jgi:serine/threonine-protein kinase
LSDHRTPDPAQDLVLDRATPPRGTPIPGPDGVARTGEHLSGRFLGRYAVHVRVGSGGFARVYRAYDPDLDLDVALKLLKPEIAEDPDTVERFRREASTAAKLRHPNVATVLNVGRLDEPFEDVPAGTPFLVMDFLPDGLGRRLADRGSLPEDDLARIGEDVARGLAYAHDRGVVHRDVKPDNVLFAADGRALVTDFGIARAVHAGASTSSRQVVLGTPSYFSPEQARGLPLDGRSDLYSLGVTLYQAATGTLPFAGDDWYDVMRQHVETEPPPPRERAPHLSAAFEAIVLRCLAKQPADRFQTAGELAEALAAVRLHGAEAATIALPALSGPRRRPRAHRRGALAAIAVGAAVAAAVGLWLARSDGAAATRARLSGRAAAVPDSARAPVPAAESALTVLDTAPPLPLLGSVVVDAPPGATVSLDGRTVARGPWRSDSVPPGRHVVRGLLPSLEGCPTSLDVRTIDLKAGQSTPAPLRLAPCGELQLDVRPAVRARYTLTAVRGPVQRSGTIPLTEPLVLPQGIYRLIVQANLCTEFRDDSVRVTAAGGPVRPVVLTLFCD